MPEASEQPDKKATAKQLFGKGLIGILIVAMAAAVFFVFYVSPQSQYERDRIYRSMNDVSRLLDDKTQAAEQTFRTWNCARDSIADHASCYADFGSKISQVEQDAKAELPGFAFGCTRKNIVCLGSDRNLEPPDSRLKHASVSLDAIAQGARPPYREAILLIMNADGQVVAGYDADRKWEQFQTLRPLIDVNRDATTDEKGKAAQSLSLAGVDVSQLFNAAQRTGRGAENALFEGYPARLSRSIGGQGYSIFIAAFEIGRSRRAEAGDTGNPIEVWVQGGQGSKPAGAKGEDGKPGAAGPDDFLYFAYVIPDRVIDGAALRIPSDWIVNILLMLVCALLGIPFLKLFSRSPLKPVRVLDLGALLISMMLIVTTATLFLTAVMLRSSVAQDIRHELSSIATSVAGDVHAQASRFTGRPAAVAQLVDFGCKRRELQGDGKANSPLPIRSKHDLAMLAPLESVFVIARTGACSVDSPLCGKGLWFGAAPLPGQLRITDRAYFRAWRDGDPQLGTNSYVQFLRSKANGKLSWSYVVDSAPGIRLPSCAAGAPDVGDNGFVVSAMPLALRAPVLPRNYSFMIVLNGDLPDALRSAGSEQVGDVQYHSDQPRSLIENALREAREDPQLAAAIWTLRDERGGIPGDGESRLIPINYHGSSYFALVRPIAGVPLSVIALFDRREAQGLFAQTMAQSFFLCCVWILLCIAACWLTPRIIRWTRGPHDTAKERALPLRGRSIWFFPNGLFQHVPDGFSYAARAGVDEIILLGATLGAQVASYLLLPPAPAVIAISLCSLMALIAEYLLIVRPVGGGLTVTWRRVLIVVTGLSMGLLLFAVLTRNLSGRWSVLALGVLLAVAVVANLYVTRRLLGVATDTRKVVVAHPDRTQVAAIRRSFLLRGFVLLMVVVAIPTCGFLNLIYYENLKGYVSASLITASERIADQRTVLRRDIERRFDVDRATLQRMGIEGFASTTPGWYLSKANGVFSVSAVPAGGLSKCQQGDLITGFVDRVTPHYASSNSEVRDSAARVQEMCGANGDRWFDLSAPGDFVAPGARLDRADADLVLRAGPSKGLSLHPTWEAGAVAVLVAVLFGGFFYGLLKKTAICLTGLYLTPVKPTGAARAELDAQIDTDPALAWSKIESAGKRVRLVALACGRTINFSDRAPIRALVEEGYLELTPYVRIANDRLADFLRYDLPRTERDHILEHAYHHRDHWDRMRLPIFIGFGAGCVLLAYTAPNAIELVMSAFLAATALVPFARDPISRFINVQRAGA